MVKIYLLIYYSFRVFLNTMPITTARKSNPNNLTKVRQYHHLFDLSQITARHFEKQSSLFEDPYDYYKAPAQAGHFCLRLTSLSRCYYRRSQNIKKLRNFGILNIRFH